MKQSRRKVQQINTECILKREKVTSDVVREMDGSKTEPLPRVCVLCETKSPC